METRKLLGLALGLPLLLAGCSSAYKSNQHAAMGHAASGAQTSATGEYAGIAGTDSAIADEQLLKEVVFYFDFDKSNVSAMDQDTIRAHANYLLQHPEAKLRIEGHTDERGSREYNVALGERRAQSLSRVLMLEGAPKGQIAVVSYGEEKPAMQGHEEAAWRYNRRGVFVYEVS